MPRSSRSSSSARRASSTGGKEDGQPAEGASERNKVGGQGQCAGPGAAAGSAPPAPPGPSRAPSLTAAASSSAVAAGSASATSASATSAASNAVIASATPEKQPTEESLVLAYLRKYGLSDAATELQGILRKEQVAGRSAGRRISSSGPSESRKRRRNDSSSATEGVGGGGDEGSPKRKPLPQIDYDVADDDDIDMEDAAAAAVGGKVAPTAGAGDSHDRRGEGAGSGTLAAATGGGFGYDLDAAPTIALWGAGSAPPSLRNRKLSRLLLEGREMDGEGGDGREKDEIEAMVNFRDEARRYIEGFTSLVTWILTLPDDPANPIAKIKTVGKPPLLAPLKGPTSKVDSTKKDVSSSVERLGDDSMDVDDNGGSGLEKPHEGLANLVGHALAAADFDPSRSRPIDSNSITLPLGASVPSSVAHDLLLPPSSKPELLSLSFPLLVHTYCELLTCGLEHTALALLDTYRHLYEPMHRNEIADLDRCNSLETIVQLNEDVISQSVVHSETRMINSQIGLVSRKANDLKKELEILRSKSKRSADDEKLLTEQNKKLGGYEDRLAKYKHKLDELNMKNNSLTIKLLALPFLRRARALKWNITISLSSFSALAGFVQSRDELLPMSALLQSRCHLIVERRDPLPFCPPAVLEDMGKDIGKDKNVRWAAPVHPAARAMEAGQDANARSILMPAEALPFPKLGLEDGDDGEASTRAAVEFNRALLINGFRRLDALTLKREYEAGLLPDSSDVCTQARMANPLKPSVLLATLCSSHPGAEADAGAGPTAPWMEPDVGIASASICPPDGRKVAAGCDDAAVRIWSLDRSATSDGQDRSTESSLGQASTVLLGHKNGFPVFDVDWTRDGRTLLSAGGDGTVRLWDTAAVGPYGRLSNVMHQKNNVSHTVGGPASTSLSSVVVPGSKAESLVEVGGAALSVYRGHAPSVPVWSVSSAPCGYYFASAGGDYTAQIWTTDRTHPVRVLAGHVSPSVNCVAWHPNCNYVMTAGDDKMCRMFDIQTGRCVRLLSGSARGLGLVRVSPSGRIAAASGYDGTVMMWDLGSGRLINELRANNQRAGFSEGMVHSMSFSSCGAALAVSGEDCTLRVWDVRGAGNHLSNPDYFVSTCGPDAVSSFTGASQMGRVTIDECSRPGTKVPTKVFRTNGVSIMDLKFTKRNLLLAVGCF